MLEIYIVHGDSITEATLFSATSNTRLLDRCHVPLSPQRSKAKFPFHSSIFLFLWASVSFFEQVRAGNLCFFLFYFPCWLSHRAIETRCFEQTFDAQVRSVEVVLSCLSTSVGHLRIKWAPLVKIALWKCLSKSSFSTDHSPQRGVGSCEMQPNAIHPNAQ